MRPISEKRALNRLADVQAHFREEVNRVYEKNARPCSTCPTFGSCCIDAHFVNVRITRLEARSIVKTLDELPRKERVAVQGRIDDTARELEMLAESEDHKFSCPLFEKQVGCLVHDAGKPSACVVHACYDDAADLPPDEVLAQQEEKISRLSERVYGSGSTWLPLPLALVRIASDCW